MAHARTTNKDARFLEQEARGRRTRYMWSKWIKIAQDRADDTSADSAITADIISNQTVRIPLGFAPCNGKIVRCTTNATQWIETGTGGSVVAGFYKANIGATDTLISLGGGTLTDGTGTATGSPITLVPGANTPTITVAGTFVVNLPVGVTGTAVTDGWTVTGSPVALVAGNNTVTVQVGGVGTITVTVNGLTMSW
ncbi:MAG: hypothetical protein Q7R49_05650, partial [Candidatus Daviesbacteria bacterium]|nr:hypothetical protein [Candidatus Daviesbacteria bacterium]